MSDTAEMRQHVSPRRTSIQAETRRRMASWITADPAATNGTVPPARGIGRVILFFIGLQKDELRPNRTLESSSMEYVKRRAEEKGAAAGGYD